MSDDLDADKARSTHLSDQDTKRASDDALVLVKFYAQLLQGDIPVDLANDLTRAYADSWFAESDDD